MAKKVTQSRQRQEKQRSEKNGLCPCCKGFKEISHTTECGSNAYIECELCNGSGKFKILPGMNICQNCSGQKTILIDNGGIKTCHSCNGEGFTHN